MKKALIFMIGLLSGSFMVSCGPSQAEIDKAFNYVYNECKHPYEVQAFIDKYREHITPARLDSAKHIHKWLTADSNLYVKIRQTEDIVEKYELIEKYNSNYSNGGTYSDKVADMMINLYDKAAEARESRAFIASRNELYKRSRWISNPQTTISLDKKYIMDIYILAAFEQADVKTGKGKGKISMLHKDKNDTVATHDTEFIYTIDKQGNLMCDITKKGEYFNRYFGDVETFRLWHNNDKLVYSDANFKNRILHEIFE